ncbi:hypothetical protein R3W88_033112 [Solanum pinnatisectum]|uniref:Uncharacterized protein n=1 Tax=Solanum pinnatisectum TaxID=50273 RepID=A0AAV9K326_9SOLN|nr:hypothetical protein R3W88_033112 [Solanum pinnatisectum]
MSNLGGEEERDHQEAEIQGRNNSTLQAMHQQFERWNLQFQEMGNMITEQNDTIIAIRRENNVDQPHNNVRPQVRRNVPHIHFLHPEYDNDDINDEFNLERRDKRGKKDRVEDDNVSSIKLNMSSFMGTRDPDLYLDWAKQVEAIFDCHNYSEGKKRKRHNNSWRGRPNTISKKPWSNQEGKVPSKPQEDRGKGIVEERFKTFNPEFSKPSSYIQCHKFHGRGHMMHKCPSRRNIILRDNGEYESVSEEDYLELPNDSIIGVVRRIMTMNLGSIDEGHRENLFHTRCVIKGKTYSMIIDGGKVVQMLQWLNDSGEVKVNKQCIPSFNVGRYEDEILCDVLPMQACHVLLGQPWQYDRDTTHHGRKNRYSLLYNCKKFTLAPLSSSQVFEDKK